MKIFNWKRLRDITLSGYELDDGLDRDLELLLRVKGDERKKEEAYLVPKVRRTKFTRAVRIPRNRSECAFFLQEYRHGIDMYDDAVIVPGTIVDELANPSEKKVSNMAGTLKSVRIPKNNPGYSYYLQEYPYDIEKTDEDIIVPNSVLKR